jgi:hypothetical protein
MRDRFIASEIRKRENESRLAKEITLTDTQILLQKAKTPADVETFLFNRLKKSIDTSWENGYSMGRMYREKSKDEIKSDVKIPGKSEIVSRMSGVILSQSNGYNQLIMAAVSILELTGFSRDKALNSPAVGKIVNQFVNDLKSDMQQINNLLHNFGTMWGANGK